MPAALAPIAGSVIGGLMSSGSSRGQTATKDPWKPAVKPLTDTLEEGQRLQDYYRQNPLNAQQRQGYENLFSDLDLYRNQIMPGMAQLAAGMMGQNYQRGPRNSQLEAMGQSTGNMGSIGGGMQNMRSSASMGAPYGAPPISPFGAGLSELLASALTPRQQQRPQGAYGPIDWAQSNPYTRDGGAAMKPPEPPPVAVAPAMPDGMAAWHLAQYENWLAGQRSGN